MKILLFSLLTLGIAAFASDPIYGTKENPGLVDDPGCKALITGQLRDNKLNPKDYTIAYYDSTAIAGGAMNSYVVTKKATNVKVFVIVAIHFGPMPSSSPTPTPTPLPSNLKST